MGKKNYKATNNEDKRVYPIKVRLIKPNLANQDKVVYNNIELYTYKDTIIENVDETDSHKIAEEINTKSKKTRAKVKKDGSVEVKQSLNG